LIVIHGTALDVVHWHSAAPVTSTRALWPAAGDVTVSGATVNVHPPAWVTVNVWPAIVSVPVRCPPGFAAAAYVTLPGVLPLAGLVIDNQSALAVADHAHPPGAFTVIVPPPPAAGTVSLVGASVNEHPPSCPSTNVCPPTLTVPDLGGPGFAGIESWTIAVPLPAPFAGDVIVIHGV
jgi:hypothetical protein